MAHESFDVIIIGSGQGGGPLASAFAGAGRRTALIEREHVGGTCINTGCTPTKTMIASGRVAYLTRRAADYGVRTGEIGIDMDVIRQRKRDIVEQFRSGSESRLRGTEGLELVEGQARFVGDKTLKVALNDGGTRTMHAETIVLDVGERPRPLGVDLPAGVTVHDSTTIMEVDAVPEQLVVVGGGVIGLEFGQLFRRLGAEVTIVHRGERLAGREDPDIADEIATIFREDGISLELNASPASIAYDGERLSVTIERKDGSTAEVCASHVLAAAGRVPNTDTLDVELTGLKLDKRGYVETDDRLETDVRGIYAIGDIRPGPKFTHISYDDYRILKANLIDGGDRSVSDRQVPYTVFIDPQLGRVGMSEQQAREAGLPYKVARMPMSSVARALETDETRGLMKVLVHAETDRIVGAAVLGVEGGEVMSMIEIAMMGDLPYTALRDGVFAHPNLSEALNNVFASLEDPSPA
ncbi:MAG TPA: mercuric reductase [Thermomicrobiales bacterium]|nr:mercuric reductase [Thermomicrobiales bacterium]